jgi:hypothetical protein
VTGNDPDLRLFGSGRVEPWPIGDEQRRAVVEGVADLALNAADDRDRLAAAPVLVAMDRLNLRWEGLRGEREEAGRPYRPCSPGRPA